MAYGFIFHIHSCLFCCFNVRTGVLLAALKAFIKSFILLHHNSRLCLQRIAIYRISLQELGLLGFAARKAISTSFMCYMKTVSDLLLSVLI